MTLRSRTVILFRSSSQPLTRSKRHGFSLNWTYGTPTTWSASKKEMSGKQLSTPPEVTANILSCCSDLQMRPQSSKPWSTTSSGMSSTATYSSTWMTFLYSQKPWKNTSPTSISSPSVCWKIAYSPRLKSANSTGPLSSSSASWWPEENWRWTLRKPKQWFLG